jgi:hypothetical protein
MSWFKPKPGVDIRFTLQGQRLNARVPAAVAAHIATMGEDIAELLEERGLLRQRINDLNTEAEQTLLSTTAMHQRQQARIHALTEENEALRQAAINAEKAAEQLRISMAVELDEVKKLDAENVQLAAELLEATGRLRDAEERLASYERVAS